MSNSTNNIQIQFNYLDVENCFKNFYVVPDYQREYVWTEVQINQLLDDIYEEFDFNPNKEYFIGSTVVFKNNDGFYELIDGQQRITALSTALNKIEIVNNNYKKERIIISFNPITEEFKVRDNGTKRGKEWIILW